jgi:transposase
VHLVCDGHGRPLAAEVTAGQRQECTQVEAVLGEVKRRRPRGRPRCRPVRPAGGTGSGYRRARRWLRRRGLRAVIPRRKDQRPGDGRVKFDREACRRRAVAERCVGWLKECRAVATRFDRLAVNDLAAAKLAMVQRYLRSSTPC